MRSLALAALLFAVCTSAAIAADAPDNYWPMDAKAYVILDATKLPPGKHTLQLVMGDESHVPHNPPLVSKKITITVE